MAVCITPLPDVNSVAEVAGGQLEPFPKRLNAVPPRIALGFVPGYPVQSYKEDNKLWQKHVMAYKKTNKFLDTGRYHNIMDMNAGLGSFAAVLESPKLWVMNVVPTIADTSTLGVIYERGLIGMYHDWYVVLLRVAVMGSSHIHPILFFHFDGEIDSLVVFYKRSYLLFFVCGTCPFAIYIVSSRNENDVEGDNYCSMRKMRLWGGVILLQHYCQACCVNSLHFGCDLWMGLVHDCLMIFQDECLCVHFSSLLFQV
jgi:hypothetical protein